MVDVPRQCLNEKKKKKTTTAFNNNFFWYQFFFSFSLLLFLIFLQSFSSFNILTIFLFNTAVMSFYIKVPNVTAQFVVAAVTWYFHSIECAANAKGVDDSLQYILRLLTLWYNHGSTAKVQMALQNFVFIFWILLFWFLAISC